MLLPLIGYTLFSWLAILSKNLHNFVGPVLVVALPIMIVLFMRENLPRACDWPWLRKVGGMLTGEHVPCGQGECRPEDPVLGDGRRPRPHAVRHRADPRLPELQPDAADDADRERDPHDRRRWRPSCLLAGHIYLGTIGMKGAWEAMRYGYVDETWAKEHHEYWYNDVDGRAASRAATGPPPAVDPSRGRVTRPSSCRRRKER